MGVYRIPEVFKTNANARPSRMSTYEFEIENGYYIITVFRLIRLKLWDTFLDVQI